MLRNKQVITGKKQTRKQKKNVKNNIKNGRSAGRERRSCYTTQADRFCDKLSMKKKQIKTIKISSHSGTAYIELKTTY